MTMVMMMLNCWWWYWWCRPSRRVSTWSGWVSCRVITLTANISWQWVQHLMVVSINDRLHQLAYSVVRCNSLCGLVALWSGHLTYDEQVTGSNPCHVAARNLNWRVGPRPKGPKIAVKAKSRGRVLGKPPTHQLHVLGKLCKHFWSWESPKNACSWCKFR